MTGIHRAAFLPDLLIAALNRNGDRPAVYIGDEVLSASELRDQISRYAQAYVAQGLTPGTGVAMLSKNHPEVVYAMGAYMVTGCRNTPLHPLGSLDDHAYVLGDAEIDTLVFDPAFSEHVAQLPARVPRLRRLLSLGPCDVGEDVVAQATAFAPGPLVAAEVDAEDLSALSYTGGTTGGPRAS